MSYDNWKLRLEAAKLPTVAARRAAIAKLGINFSQPGEADEGYYRKPLTIKDPSGNGKTIITGWVPVAYYLYDGKLVGDINGQAMSPRDVTDEQLWSWVVSHPIEYDLYKAVVEHGAAWPDLPTQTEVEFMGKVETFPVNGGASFEEMERGKIVPAEPPLDPIERIVGRDHNAPPEVLPEVEHATAIDNAIGAAPTKVTNDGEAAIAAGSKNRIAELRLAAAKAGKARYEPLYAVYVAERNKWLPMIGRAETAEKNLQTTILSWRESERIRIEHLRQEAERLQREREWAAERAAQRAIAAAQPEPAPVVEAVAPLPQMAPIEPTHGTRKVKEELKKFAVIVDDVEVYRHFSTNPDVRDLLQRLATMSIRAGMAVPGTTTEERLI